jgi:hypothetical protein
MALLKGPVMDSLVQNAGRVTLSTLNASGTLQDIEVTNAGSQSRKRLS